jgi:hypothetical protein
MKPVEIDLVAAEDIDCGSDVTIRATDFMAYQSDPLIAGTAIGYAAERLRKGFRIVAKGGVVREVER